MEAKISLCYDDSAMSKAVTKAVNPDNSKTPLGLRLKTMCVNGKVTTKLKCDKMPTFIATIDDLLSCISTAEKSVQTAKRLNDAP